jgi:hypothetical protein
VAKKDLRAERRWGMAAMTRTPGADRGQDVQLQSYLCVGTSEGLLSGYCSLAFEASRGEVGDDHEKDLARV